MLSRNRVREPHIYTKISDGRNRRVKVFVLEDNLMQRQRLVRIIEAYAQQKKMNIEVLDTAKVSELIQNIESESFDQLYFLDIDIKNESKKGLEIAQEIRKLDNRGTIVFVTTHSEFAPITYKYKVSALDFIDKSDPEMIQRVEEAL
nr:response regulator [Enterococcus cecorum]